MPNTKKPNIKFIRLVTGEDVVSEVQESENGLCLVNPLKIIYGVNQKTGYISIDRKSTRLNSSHSQQSRMPSSA